MKGKKTRFIVFLIIAIAFLWLLIYKLENRTNNEVEKDTNSSEITYFYGKECPHCMRVQEFLDENNIKEKVDFEKREVWHNKENQEEMMGKANECGLDIMSVGVPFLYADGKCVIGEPSVINFFKNKADLK